MSARDPDQPESTQAIFDRITSRRTARRPAPPVPQPVPQPLPGDGLVEPNHPTPGAPSLPEEPMADRFPRSTTMRTLLRHPALAVGVGVPAAALLLANPAARRLLKTGLVLGSRPEVRAVVGAALAAAGQAIEGRRRRAGTATEATPEPQEPSTIRDPQ